MATDYRTEWTALDPSRRERLQRALDISGAGSYLMQPEIDKVIQQIVDRNSPLLANLPRKDGAGLAWYVNRRTPGTTGGAWVADTDSATEETGTISQATFTYRTALTRGRVTRKLQAVGRSYSDALADEMEAKLGDFRDLLESSYIIGDNASNTKQPSGLLTLIGNVSGQVIAQTTAAAGDDLTLAKLDEAIDKVKGSPTNMLIIASKAGKRKINAALQARQEFQNVIEIAAGFRVTTYDDIPVLWSSKMPDDLTWNGSKVSAFSGGQTTAIIIVNTEYVWQGVLTKLTALPLAKASSQYDEFDIFTDIVLVHANTLGAAYLGGISPS